SGTSSRPRPASTRSIGSDRRTSNLCGGRAHIPACRRTATGGGRCSTRGVEGGEEQSWGGGQQTRSFMYVDDCIRGTELIATGRYPEPINLGSSELVTINQLGDVGEAIAGGKLRRRY